MAFGAMTTRGTVRPAGNALPGGGGKFGAGYAERVKQRQQSLGAVDAAADTVNAVPLERGLNRDREQEEQTAKALAGNAASAVIALRGQDDAAAQREFSNSLALDQRDMQRDNLDRADEDRELQRLDRQQTRQDQLNQQDRAERLTREGWKATGDRAIELERQRQQKPQKPGRPTAPFDPKIYEGRFRTARPMPRDPLADGYAEQMKKWEADRDAYVKQMQGEYERTYGAPPAAGSAPAAVPEDNQPGADNYGQDMRDAQNPNLTAADMAKRDAQPAMPAQAPRAAQPAAVAPVQAQRPVAAPQAPVAGHPVVQQRQQVPAQAAPLRPGDPAYQFYSNQFINGTPEQQREAATILGNDMTGVQADPYESVALRDKVMEDAKRNSNGVAPEPIQRQVAPAPRSIVENPGQDAVAMASRQAQLPRVNVLPNNGPVLGPSADRPEMRIAERIKDMPNPSFDRYVQAGAERKEILTPDVMRQINRETNMGSTNRSGSLADIRSEQVGRPQIVPTVAGSAASTIGDVAGGAYALAGETADELATMAIDSYGMAPRDRTASEVATANRESITPQMKPINLPTPPAGAVSVRHHPATGQAIGWVMADGTVLPI